MPVAKKKNIRKSGKTPLVHSSNAVVVMLTNEKKTLFSGKLEKVNEMLSNAELMD
ncbi:MAG: hypothetical protein P4L51_16750 [Puia sp.]|nr:hypothetical protein [Puia sp.]